MFVLLLPVTFGFCALSVDLSYMQFTNMQLQHVADAASHAALIRYRQTQDMGDGDDAAEQMVQANWVGNGHATLEDVDYGTFLNGNFTQSNTVINAAQATVSRTGDNAIDLFFAPLLPVINVAMGGNPADSDSQFFHTFEPTTVSITSSRTREICIAQDITGSFVDDIGFARQADLAFLDFFNDQPYPGDKIAMSTFVGGVEPNIWTPLTSIEDNYGAINAQWSILDSCNCNYWHWYYGPNWCIYYYGNYNGQPWMQSCFDWGQQTAQGPGIEQCVDEFLANGNPTAFQGIIVVSDGLPYGTVAPDYTAIRKAAAVDASDYAWDNGVHVWSVAYMNGGGDFTFLQSLVRGYGVAFETPDPSELEDIMIEIAQSIPIVLVE